MRKVMLDKARWSLKKGWNRTVILLMSSLVLHGSVPEGWILAGSNPENYESGVDPQAAYNDHPSIYLRSNKSGIEGMGTLMQRFGADKYLGKRARFSAFVKAESVQEGWAGLWMRVDGNHAALAIDNMQDRPIKGTTDWQKYEVVLDVPSNASGIAVGILLEGNGSV